MYIGDGMAHENDWCDGKCVENGQNQEAIIRNNIIINCNGLGNSGGINIVSDRASKIFHNTVINVKNNPFYGNDSNNSEFTNNTTEYQSNILQQGLSINSSNPYTDIDNIHFDNISYINNIFQNAVYGDFTLKSTNNILNNGQSLQLVKYDFCGNLRDSTPDIGAIEYGAEQKSCLKKIQELYNSI